MTKNDESFQNWANSEMGINNTSARRAWQASRKQAFEEWKKDAIFIAEYHRKQAIQECLEILNKAASIDECACSRNARNEIKNFLRGV